MPTNPIGITGLLLGSVFQFLSVHTGININQAAHIIYDDAQDEVAANEAKAELTQQIFTKTMTLQVWRPENERAGRHFVYTTRYVYFFVRLLNQVNDRANMDMLVRRVRRKMSDYVNHTKLWEDICLTYIKVSTP